MSGKSLMLHCSIVETRPECGVTDDVFKRGGKRSMHPSNTHHLSRSLEKKAARRKHNFSSLSVFMWFTNKTRREKRGTEAIVNVSKKKIKNRQLNS